MRYHDFHLAGYSVSKFGGEIVLDLVWNYPDQPFDQSLIRFAEVAAYHFVHTGGAIITEIMPVTLASLFAEFGDRFTEWYRLHGAFIHWSDDRAAYISTLETRGYSAWAIISAIGFEGFVIAKSVGEDSGDAKSPA